MLGMLHRSSSFYIETLHNNIMLAVLKDLKSYSNFALYQSA